MLAALLLNQPLAAELVDPRCRWVLPDGQRVFCTYEEIEEYYEWLEGLKLPKRKKGIGRMKIKTTIYTLKYYIDKVKND